MRCAVIINGRVDNMIEVDPDSDFALPGAEIVPAGNTSADIGDLYADGVFVKPNTEV